MVYEKEIEASFEAPDVVKAKLFARARELKARNEAERKRQAAELEMRRFRQSSDVLRARDSVIMAQRLADERVEQLHEKTARMRAAKAEDRRQELAILQRAEAAREREAAEQRKRKEADERLRIELDAQATVKAELVRRARDHDAALDRDALTRWQAEQEAAVARETERRRAARAELERTRAYNSEWDSIRRSEASKESEGDAERLRAILEREAAEEKAERDYAASLKAEAMAHQSALQRQMAVEAEAGDRFDSYFAAYQEKEWAKREAQWAAQREARRRLDEEVAATRSRQRAEKAEQKSWEAAEDERVEAAIAERDALLAEEEDRRRRALKEGVQAQKTVLEEQMRRRSAMRAREAQLAYLETKMQDREEARYQAKVEKLLAEPPSAASRHARKKPLVL